MYCFQCGEELVKGAKFCHVCGANQEEARKLFEENFKSASPTTGLDHPASGGDTKVAYSSDPEDGEALKNYLNKVDTHVGMSIQKHETLSGARPKPKKEKTKKKADAPDKKTASAPLAAADEIKAADAPAKKQDEKKKKKSFSAIWNSFIDEEDNPYSVFGEMADRLERDQKVLDDSEADRLRVSQDMDAMDQESFAQTGDVSSLNKKVNAILDAQEKEEEKKITSKGILSSFFSKNKDSDETAPQEKEARKETIKPADAFGKADKPADEKIQPADAFDTVDKLADEKIQPADAFGDTKASVSGPVEKEPAAEKSDVALDKAARKQAKKEAKAAAKAQKAAKKEAAAGEKKENPFASFFAGLSKEKSDVDKAKHSAEVKHHHHVSELSDNVYVLKAYDKLAPARERVLAKGKQGVYGLLGIGFILSTVPIVFAFRGIGILAIVFALLKALIDLFRFFFANNVARTNSCTEDNLRARTVDNLFHWILYLIPSTIIFFVLPASSAMGRTVLGSVTPHFLLSILLYVWVMFLAYASAHSILPKENSRDFLAWYGIIFVSIDLISKLFWIIAIFLTSTFV
ncbi:hypothetical protein [Peptoniphilus sp. HCN-40583]|uniref:hypothetical protein n=1 Tax=Peptoniphilus sp. HCN-40583 TaxID=3134662 RepID=UPI0030BCD70C